MPLLYNRPLIGYGVQGDAPDLLRHKHELLLVLNGDWDYYWRLYESVPEADRPQLWYRHYDRDTMSHDPFLFGRERAADAVIVREIWGENFGGLIGINEANLANEHAHEFEGEGHWSWERQVYWESYDGYKAMRDWEIEFIRGVDSIDPTLNIGVCALSPGHHEDGPDVAQDGYYGYQDGLLGDVVKYQRPGPGEIVLVVHSYWGLWAPREGLRDALAEWLAFRVWREEGYKDLVEQDVFNDPGGPATIFPDTKLLIGEWNSPDNSRDIPLEYTMDAVFFHRELQTRYAKNLIGSAVFLYKSEGVDHGEYTHWGQPVLAQLDIYISSLPALSGPSEEPVSIYDRHKVYDRWAETFGAAGYNPTAAIMIAWQKAQAEDDDWGVPLAPEVEDGPFITQNFADGIAFVLKGDWANVGFARTEEELPLA
jgi:hypothetical protein